MKYLLRYRLRDLVHQNLELTVLHAVDGIEPEDLVNISGIQIILMCEQLF